MWCASRTVGWRNRWRSGCSSRTSTPPGPAAAPGCLISSLANGVKALMYSASFFPEDEEEPEEPSRFELWLDRHLGSEKAASFFITVAVVLGIVFSVGLFILLPTALTGLVGLAVPLPMWLRNLLEGVVRIVIFMGYLMLCSRMKDIHRVFQYHGAEHKTIFCYEHGLPLTVENVRIQPRHHPRCGTSFLFVVIVVSILLSSVLFSFVEVTNTFARMGLHLLLLPVIVSLTYELNRVVGRYDNRLTRLVSLGMWLQNWTCFEPDDSDRGGHPGLYTGAAGGEGEGSVVKGTGGMRHQQK
ncbi:MAG: DUF1385 domain-containing protein [Flavonifractor plautii]